MWRARARTLLLIGHMVACAPHPRAASLPSGAQIARFRIGELDAVALKDGDIAVINDGMTFGLGAKRGEATSLLVAAGLPPDRMQLSIQPLLVKTGAGLLLFDTGGAGDASAHAGHVVQSLVLAGYEPRDITDIFVTHGHPDHIGGLVTASGALSFPNATIHMAAPEWSAMQTDVAHLCAIIAAKVAVFEPGARLSPEVRAVATPGHTQGHSAYEITSAGETLLVVGDIVHHFVLSLARPDWAVAYDADAARARAVRESVLGTLAAGGGRVHAVHFPFPGIGHVIAYGDGYAWIPER